MFRNKRKAETTEKTMFLLWFLEKSSERDLTFMTSSGWGGGEGSQVKNGQFSDGRGGGDPQEGGFTENGCPELQLA